MFNFNMMVCMRLIWPCRSNLSLVQLLFVSYNIDWYAKLFSDSRVLVGAEYFWLRGRGPLAYALHVPQKEVTNHQVKWSKFSSRSKSTNHLWDEGIWYYPPSYSLLITYQLPRSITSCGHGSFLIVLVSDPFRWEK